MKMAQMVRFAKQGSMLLAQCLGLRVARMDPELHRAAMDGDVPTFMWKIQDTSIMTLLQTTPGGDTALHIAARHGNEDLVRRMLSLFKERSIILSLLSVIFFCSTSVCRIRNAAGNTALHEAAKKGLDGVIAAILEHDRGMALITNKMGETALCVACGRGYYDSVQRLLPQSDRLHNVKNGQTCFHLVATRGTLNILQLLVEGYGKGFQGLGIADYAGATALHSAVEGGNVEMVKYILRMKSDLVYLRDNMGRGAIHVAALKGELQILKVIAENCPDCVDMRSRDGKTILHFAVQGQHINVVEWISQQGLYLFDGNEQDKNGNMPLHLAAIYYCDEKIMNTLITEFPRVDVKVRNKEGFSCMDLVNRHSYPRVEEVKECLLRSGAVAELEATECNILHSDAEKKEHYNRMIQTNALIAALLAALSAQLPAINVLFKNGVVVGSLQSFIVCNDVAFFSSMTVLVVWILFEPLSWTGMCTWLQSSMYILGIAIVATSYSFFIVMGRFALKQSPLSTQQNPHLWFSHLFPHMMASSLTGPLMLVLILLKMLISIYKDSHQLKESIRTFIRRSASRIYIVIISVAWLDERTYLLVLTVGTVALVLLDAYSFITFLTTVASGLCYYLLYAYV